MLVAAAFAPVAAAGRLSHTCAGPPRRSDAIVSSALASDATRSTEAGRCIWRRVVTSDHKPALNTVSGDVKRRQRQ